MQEEGLVVSQTPHRNSMFQGSTTALSVFQRLRYSRQHIARPTKPMVTGVAIFSGRTWFFISLLTCSTA